MTSFGRNRVKGSMKNLAQFKQARKGRVHQFRSNQRVNKRILITRIINNR